MTHAQKKTTPTVTNLHEGKDRPARRMMASFEEFEHFFEQLRNRDWKHQFHWPDAVQSHIPMFAEGKVPKVDIVDNDKDVLIRAELPGVNKKDLDISMTDNSVTIKANSRYDKKKEKGNYFRSEIAQGQYIRTLGLPSDVDIEQAKTYFKDGVLELTVPKLAHSQRRNIKIE